MIKLDTKDWKVKTDCRTVGEFMTEAASIFEGNLTVIVDGCRYEFYDSPKIRVTDDTPINLVYLDGICSGGIGPDTLYIKVLTKPKPKTVKKSGWVNIYKCDVGRTTGRIIFETETAAKLARSLEGLKKVDTVCVEWEEVPE